MGEPITKERLYKYIFIRREVENHLDRITRMKNQALIPARRSGDGAQHTQSGADRMAEAIIKRIAYEDKTAEQIKTKLDEMDKIRGAIDALDDPMEREVLRLRYIDGAGYHHMAWHDVALYLYGDDDEAKVRSVYRIHGRALQHIRSIEA